MGSLKSNLQKSMSRSRSASPRESREFERNRSRSPPAREGGGGGGGFGGGPKIRSEELFSVMVNNIPTRCNKRDVEECFTQFGELGDVFLPPDRKYGRHPDDHRGYAFVRFFKKEDQEHCVDSITRKPLFLRDAELAVKFATTRPRDKPGYEQGRGGGRDFGGRGGGRDFGGRGGYDDRDRGGRGGYDDRRGGGYDRRDDDRGRDRYDDRDRGGYGRGRSRSPPRYDRGGY